LIPNDCNEIWVGAFIGNYDKGGHSVSLDLEFYPSFEENETKKKSIIPLFNTLNILEASGQNYGKLFKTDTLVVEFEITEVLFEDNKLVLNCIFEYDVLKSKLIFKNKSKKIFKKLQITYGFKNYFEFEKLLASKKKEFDKHLNKLNRGDL
jgi:hypothetical protein